MARCRCYWFIGSVIRLSITVRFEFANVPVQSGFAPSLETYFPRFRRSQQMTSFRRFSIIFSSSYRFVYSSPNDRFVLSRRTIFAIIRASYNIPFRRNREKSNTDPRDVCLFWPRHAELSETLARLRTTSLNDCLAFAKVTRTRKRALKLERDPRIGFIVSIEKYFVAKLKFRKNKSENVIEYVFETTRSEILLCFYIITHARARIHPLMWTRTSTISTGYIRFRVGRTKNV